MNNNEMDELIRRALQSESELPQGLSERLEQHIDRLAASAPADRPAAAKRRHLPHFRLMAIAASLLVVVGLYTVLATYTAPAVQRQDTFTSPYEAAMVAQNALTLMSTQLNRGLQPVAGAARDIEEANSTVAEQLNRIIQHPQK
ncbi:MAG: hypothetical protein LBL78_04570 [Prevotellaceae bacterium]|jgi:hypothetical protein|nr:hypothetical protein [Prevotellaceae bacterium]